MASHRPAHHNGPRAVEPERWLCRHARLTCHVHRLQGSRVFTQPPPSARVGPRRTTSVVRLRELLHRECHDWHESWHPGLRGWEFCTICPFFANFSTFTKIPQVPSFQAHSPVKTVFRQNPKNARKSQNTPSTNPYQNETQFPLSSLKNATSGHARPPKSVLCPPVISGTNSRQNSLKFP